MAELRCILCEYKAANEEPATYVMNGQSLCKAHQAQAFDKDWKFSDLDELISCLEDEE